MLLLLLLGGSDGFGWRRDEDEGGDFSNDDGFHGWVGLEELKDVVGSSGGDGLVGVTLREERKEERRKEGTKVSDASGGSAKGRWGGKCTNELVDEKSKQVLLLFGLVLEELVDDGEGLSSDEGEGVVRESLRTKRRNPISVAVEMR